ncbi:MAG: CaiB/BaiF CoA transferase family protein [Candidatus Binatia bacterium]
MPFPLEDVRILDLTRLGYGAQATSILGALGAEVIRVESKTRPDPVRMIPPHLPLPGAPREEGQLSAAMVAAKGFNRGGIFHKYNFGGKRSVTLNLKHPRGIEILKRLIAKSDVLAESFSAGALARMGLGYDQLKAIRPDMIYVSMSGFGHTGRDSRHVTLGPTAQALTGLTSMVGLPGRRPAGWSFSYLDHMGGYLGALGTLAALRHRRRTGEGQHVDVSQIEPGIPLTGAAVLDRAVNGRSYRRPEKPESNRSTAPPAAPHGVYRCLVEDAWLTISVTNQRQWKALCRVMGDPPWTESADFATLEARLANQDRLDREIESWTRTGERYRLMNALLEAGVPAGVVQNARDRVERDRQLHARGYFSKLPNSETREWFAEELPFRMTRTPPAVGGRIGRGAPSIGEDNLDVYARLLGLGQAEILRGEDEGLFQ